MFGYTKNDVVEDLMNKNEELRQEINKLKTQLSGERCNSGFCSSCKHGVKSESLVYGFGLVTNYLCDLNCKCKDYEKSG